MKIHPVPKLYRTSHHPDGPSSVPDYRIDDGLISRTVTHRLGWGALPDYELRSDGRIYRTAHHPDGSSLLPEFEFRRDGQLYRAAGHPLGEGTLPEYRLQE